MQNTTNRRHEARQAVAAEPFPPLELVTRPHVPTEQAAYYLTRRPQTLRGWAMTGKVIKPHRCNGRLLWPVAEIKRILGLSK